MATRNPVPSGQIGDPNFRFDSFGMSDDGVKSCKPDTFRFMATLDANSVTDWMSLQTD